MAEYKFVDPFMVRQFNKIQAISEKYEADIIASGRYELLKIEGNKKIYIEKVTGHTLSVYFPILSKKK